LISRTFQGIENGRKMEEFSRAFQNAWEPCTEQVYSLYKMTIRLFNCWCFSDNSANKLAAQISISVTFDSSEYTTKLLHFPVKSKDRLRTAFNTGADTMWCTSFESLQAT
jgi:hypothetical protein